MSQVVHHEGDIYQSITELPVETSTPISTDEFCLMTACLDNAMAGTVTEYHMGHRISWAGGTRIGGGSQMR